MSKMNARIDHVINLEGWIRVKVPGNIKEEIWTENEEFYVDYLTGNVQDSMPTRKNIKASQEVTLDEQALFMVRFWSIVTACFFIGTEFFVTQEGEKKINWYVGEGYSFLLGILLFVMVGANVVLLISEILMANGNHPFIGHFACCFKFGCVQYYDKETDYCNMVMAIIGILTSLCECILVGLFSAKFTAGREWPTYVSIGFSAFEGFWDVINAYRAYIDMQKDWKERKMSKKASRRMQTFGHAIGMAAEAGNTGADRAARIAKVEARREEDVQKVKARKARHARQEKARKRKAKEEARKAKAVVEDEEEDVEDPVSGMERAWAGEVEMEEPYSCVADSDERPAGNESAV